MPSTRLSTALAILIFGLVCVVLWKANVSILTPVGGLVAVLVLPAFAAAQWAGGPRGADGFTRAGFAYAGLGVSCWSAWLAALVAGADGPATLIAPVLLAAIVAATGRRMPDSTAPTSARLGTGAVRNWHGSVWVAAVAVVVLVAVPFLPYGWQRADGIHRMGMTDWYKHLMVTTALQTPAFPPANPFLIADAHAPYYYGFHLLAATLEKAAGGLDPYISLLFLTLTTAAAFPVVLFVLARGLLGDGRRAAVAAVGGTLLAGFDLVVWVLHAVRDVAASWPLSISAHGIRAAVPSTHLDFWIHHNERQFSPPYISLIWAPQHVAAVLIALLALHATWSASKDDHVVSRFLPAILLASAAALSGYVALALAVGLVSCVVVDTWRQRRVPWTTDAFLRWGVVGLLAGVAAMPVAWVLAGGPGDRLTVAVSSAGSMLNGAVFSGLFGDNTLDRLLDSPALYVVELGVVGLLGFRAIRERVSKGTLSGTQREAVVIVVAILALVTVIRPPVGGPNNMYARPMLVVWALLACFAADAWCASPGRRRWRQVGVAIGAGGILLGALGATAEGFAFWATPADAVEAARWINANVPPTAVVAADPERHNLGYWLRRRTVVADRRHALLFGATNEQYDEALGRLRAALGSGEPTEAAQRLALLGADLVVVDTPTPGWARRPCFDAAYRGPSVTVLSMDRAACAP